MTNQTIRKTNLLSVLVAGAGLILGAATAGCDDGHNLQMTWFGISNWALQVGDLNMVIDGYVTRIPSEYFSGGGGGLGLTRKGYPIDKALVDKVHGVLAAEHSIKYLFTGHSHFDHSFDTPYWAKTTGAFLVGSKTTCFQTQALGVPAEHCLPVYGGEVFHLSSNVMAYVVLWNHSGTHEQNAEQHDAVELAAPPKPDADGNLRGGVAEDFPNGGGNRGYLFVVDNGDSRLSMFFTNSGSTQDLQLDTVVGGINYGSPLQSLSNAMLAAGLQSVDLWIGGGGEGVARYVVPILRPKTYIPNHLWDFFAKFEAGYDNGPFKDSGLEKYLNSVGVKLLAPAQYMDRFDLTPYGTMAVPNTAQKMALGFPDIGVPRDAGTPAMDAGRDAASDAIDLPPAFDAADGGAGTDAHSPDGPDVPQCLPATPPRDAAGDRG